MSNVEGVQTVPSIRGADGEIVAFFIGALCEGGTEGVS